MVCIQWKCCHWEADQHLNRVYKMLSNCSGSCTTYTGSRALMSPTAAHIRAALSINFSLMVAVGDTHPFFIHLKVLCFFCWFYDVVSTATMFFMGSLPFCQGRLSGVDGSPPVPDPLPRRLPLGHPSEFSEMFQLHYNKVKTVAPTQRGIHLRESCCHATHVHEQQWPFPEYCRMPMRCLDEDTLTSLALQVLLSSQYECIYALTVFQPSIDTKRWSKFNRK